jgi:hypothetical protein
MAASVFAVLIDAPADSSSYMDLRIHGNNLQRHPVAS